MLPSWDVQRKDRIVSKLANMKGIRIFVGGSDPYCCRYEGDPERDPAFVCPWLQTLFDQQPQNRLERGLGHEGIHAFCIDEVWRVSRLIA